MSCYNSIVVDAPIDEVWKAIRNFHDLDWGRPVITSVTAVGDVPGDQVGAKRVLNGAFEETLKEHDEERHYFAYSIDDAPEPVSRSSVSGYIGSIQLLPVTADNKTFVQWTSEYQADDPELVAGFCNQIYAALLASLQNHFDTLN